MNDIVVCLTEYLSIEFATKLCILYIVRRSWRLEVFHVMLRINRIIIEVDTIRSTNVYHTNETIVDE